MLKLKTKQKQIRLGKYPYTYVRSVVMRSLLFTEDDYSKMLKMGFNEIAKFLQDSTYRKEINMFANEYSGSDLLELALNRNLAESFKKLIRISGDELALLVKEYIVRKDIEDIKTILRGKFTRADEKSILKSLTAAGTLDYGILVSLLKKESIEEILKNNGVINFSLFESALKDMKEKNTLVAIENVFDYNYYSDLIEFSRTIPKEGDLFRRFLIEEVDVLNILTIARLQKAKIGKDIAKNFIIPTGDSVKDSKILKILEGDIEDLSKFIKKEYKDAIAKGTEELKKTNSLIKLETEMHKILLRQTTLLMHQHPLSVDVILGYMFAKDIEVRNLKLIVKGKQLGLSEEFIESQLVY